MLSDERGINIVRQKVKDFARIQLSNSSSVSQGGKYPCPPFKLVILDEADSMTADAQAGVASGPLKPMRKSRDSV